MTTIFTHARVIDGSGSAPFAADVLVEGNRITDIVRAEARVDWRGRAVIDCAGATLMPGLVEPHAHLSFIDQSTPHALSSMPVEEHLLATLKHAKLYLDQGFTAVLQRRGHQAAPRRRRAQRDRRRRVPGPRLLAASVQLTVTGGVGDLRQLHLDPGDAMYTLPCDGPSNSAAPRAKPAAKASTC